MSNLNRFFGGGRIKAVHRGVDSMSTNVTIPAVNMSKAFITTSFMFNSSSGSGRGTAFLSSSTSVTVQISTSGPVGSVTVYWEVVEFE